MPEGAFPSSVRTLDTPTPTPPHKGEGTLVRHRSRQSPTSAIGRVDGADIPSPLWGGAGVGVAAGRSAHTTAASTASLSGYRLCIPAIASGFSSIAARSGVSRAGWFARAENSLLTQSSG